MADLPALRARVEAAQALAAKATPGPWVMQGAQSDYAIVHPTGMQDGWATGPVVLEIDIRDARHVSAQDADLMAAAPDLVALATDLMAALEAVATERDSARAELAAVRAVLGDGADEAAWPPGLTMAQAVERLRRGGW